MVKQLIPAESGMLGCLRRFSRLLGHGFSNSDHSPVLPGVTGESSPLTPVDHFGAFGEKSEKIGEQIVYLSGRFNDFERLREEFSAVATPIYEFIASHAEAQTRLSETTALLAQERKHAQSLRHGLNDARVALEQALSEKSSMERDVQLQNEKLVEQASQIRNVTIQMEDVMSRLDFVSRQLAAEEELSTASELTRAALKSEVERLEDEALDARAQAAEARHRCAVLEAEVKHAQDLLDQLQPLLAQAKARVVDCETELQAKNVIVASLEVKIAHEMDARSTSEAQRTQDKALYENEVRSISVQLEILTRRNATTEQLLERSRALVNEKIADCRKAERAAKDAIAEKLASERGHAAAVDEAKRLATLAEASERALQETKTRHEMLVKAVAEKDLLLEHAQIKLETLTAQLKANGVRMEQERRELEIQNRKLIEENQTEKAERALAQGALSIARSSRERLLAQVEDLKRERGVYLHAPASDDETGHRHGETAAEAQSNVHVLRSSDQPRAHD